MFQISNVNLLMLLQFENVKKEYNSKVKEIKDMFDVRLRSLKEHVSTKVATSWKVLDCFS